MKTTLRLLCAVGIISLAGFFCMMLPTAFAATLSLSPASGNYTVGAVVAVKIIVSSSDQAINAVSGDLSFPTNMFSVVSISKTDSIVNFWATDPTYSNTDGTLHFEGVILNPGFTGSSGNVITAYVKVKAAGAGSIVYSDGNVLANDGKGTDVLEGTAGATFSLQQSSSPVPNANEQTTAPTTFNVTVVPRTDLTDPVVQLLFTDLPATVDHFEITTDNSPAEMTASTTYTSAPLLPGVHTFSVKAIYTDGQILFSGADVTVDPIASPSIAYYTSNILQNEYFSVFGTSTPNSEVILSLKDTRGIIIRQQTLTDSQGSFTFTWPAKLTPGTYEFHVEAEDARGAHSLPTNDMQVLVQVEPAVAWIQGFLAYGMFGIVLLGLGIMALYMGHTFKKMKQLMARNALMAESAMYKSLNILVQDVKKHVKDLQEAKAVRQLSDEENAFIQTMLADLKNTEDSANKQMENISKKL